MHSPFLSHGGLSYSSPPKDPQGKCYDDGLYSRRSRTACTNTHCCQAERLPVPAVSCILLVKPVSQYGRKPHHGLHAYSACAYGVLLSPTQQPVLYRSSARVPPTSVRSLALFCHKSGRSIGRVASHGSRAKPCPPHPPGDIGRARGRARLTLAVSSPSQAPRSFGCSRPSTPRVYLICSPSRWYRNTCSNPVGKLRDESSH